MPCGSCCCCLDRVAAPCGCWSACCDADSIAASRRGTCGDTPAEVCCCGVTTDCCVAVLNDFGLKSAQNEKFAGGCPFFASCWCWWSRCCARERSVRPLLRVLFESGKHPGLAKRRSVSRVVLASFSGQGLPTRGGAHFTYLLARQRGGQEVTTGTPEEVLRDQCGFAPLCESQTAVRQR